MRSSICRGGRISPGCSKTSKRAWRCAGSSCEYFSVCGGGEPVNKLAENGTFASTETTYCRLTKMRATDLVLDALERVQPSASDQNDPRVPCIEMAARAPDQSARWG